MVNKIIIASDHAGYEYKEAIKSYLVANNYDVIDAGTNSNERVDYPDYANLATEKIAQHNCMGVLVCGSGVGISIAANRHKHIRCALVGTSEVAIMARKHNDANVVAVGSRVTPLAEVIEIVEAFLATEFEGGRHIGRIEKMST